MSDRCKRGHPRTELSTYIHPKTGAQVCRPCRQLSQWKCRPKSLPKKGRAYGPVPWRAKKPGQPRGSEYKPDTNSAGGIR